MENLVQNNQIKIKGVIEFWKTGENPITCYDSFKTTEIDAIPKKNSKSRLQPVLLVDADGNEHSFKSVVLAADFIGISMGTLYNILGGHKKNTTGFEITKQSKNN